LGDARELVNENSVKFYTDKAEDNGVQSNDAIVLFFIYHESEWLIIRRKNL